MVWYRFQNPRIDIDRPGKRLPVRKRIFGCKLPDAVNLRNLTDQALIAQLIKSMEKAIRIPKHCANQPVLFELADVVHTRFREFAVQNKCKGCCRNFTICKADFRSVGTGDSSGGECVDDGLAAIGDTFGKRILFGKMRSNTLTVQSARADVGKDKVVDDFDLEQLCDKETVEANIPQLPDIRQGP